MTKHLVSMCILIVALGCALGCASGGSKYAARPSAERLQSDIADVFQAELNAWRAGDVQGQWDDPALHRRLSQNLGARFDALKARYATSFKPDGDVGELNVNDVLIEPFGPDSAVTYADWQFRIGNSQLKGRSTLLWRQTGIEWRVTHDQSHPAPHFDGE